MTQRFTSQRFPYVSIVVHVQEREVALEALADSGFDGGVAVPTSTATEVGTPDAYLPWTLADGTRVLSAAYRGTVQLEGFTPFPTVVIALGNEPIVGLQMLNQFRTTFDHGRELVVEQ